MAEQVSIHDILAKFRDDALNNRDLGDRFERLICRYLELDPQYSERFSNVWMFNEWPRKGETGDIGIDIVAEDAHNYIVNGKSALDWLLDRYRVTVDTKKSGIKNDPNDWCHEHNNPRYILDLLQSVAHVSTQTNTIVA
jgi:predicted helicase|tara:strand:- start:701 stop:1117 length:417 start_codon:yes stop_codon:yes gene_type:complete